MLEIISNVSVLLSYTVLSSILAWCKIIEPPVGICPKPHAPHEASGRGGTAPYWLGAAQLGRAVAVQGNVCISPTVGKDPWRLALRQSSIWLITGRLPFPVLCRRCEATLECPLQGT